MAVIYLKHPVHGQKVACSEQEAKYDETKGWSRFDPGALMREKLVENKLAEEIAAVVAVAPKKRGRPAKQEAA